MNHDEFGKRIESIRLRLYKTAFLYLGSEALAMDAVDETVYKALCSYKKLREPKYFDTWITRILINECHNELRRQKRFRPLDELTETAAEEYDSLLMQTDDHISAKIEYLIVDQKFDPEFTAAGKEYTVNQIVELEGQKITITDVEIYPSHMRVNVTDDADNTAWLKRLDFYIQTDYGMKFDPISEGITATGSSDSKSMASFRADSTYFYEAKTIKLVITGAEWLRKDMEKVYINLETGETGELPEGVEFYSAEKLKGGWILKL